jgi:DNA repair protein RadC
MPTTQPNGTARRWGIAELPAAELPERRLLDRGSGALSTTELLSVLMKGTTGKANVFELAAHVMGQAGSLRAISAMDAKELSRSAGLPRRASAKVVAALELARRFTEEEVLLAETLSGAEEAFRFLKPRLADLPHEVFAVVLMNQKHGVLAYRELFRGSIHSSSVHPREVVKAVLKENAAAVILAHNHPSGHVSPSPDDLRLTEELQGLLQHIDTRLVDHLIVGGNGYFSFAREGLLHR